MLNFLFTHTPLLYLVQSLWRDEAFSILMAQRSLGFMLDKLIFETPLYYMMLHVWVRLFGTSEIATRSLSLLGFTIATIIVIEWASSRFKSKLLALFVPFFFLFNPMLLYYAFEIRTYAWVICFTVITMLAYVEKKWTWYTLGAILAFYTHTYTIFLPVITLIHYLTYNKQLFTKPHLKKITTDPMIRASVLYGAAILPWMVRIGMHAATLAQSWYYPVDTKLITSVVGNLFLGYEGTPWYMWDYTLLLSIAILAMSVYAMIPKKTRWRNSYFFLSMMGPLTIVLGVSLFKPMFVNRYLIYVAAAEVFMIACALESLKHKRLQNILAVLLAVFVFSFNLWYPPQRPKKDIRAVIMQVNALAGEDDLIYAENSLVYFETLYYSTHKNNVFLYNPTGKIIPWYVGDALLAPAIMAREFPTYPKRAYVVRRDGTFYVTYNTLLTQKQK